jgi:hypothetical protein
MHRARSYLARVAVAPGLITLLCLAWPGLITSTFAQPVKPVNVVDVLVAYTPQARNGAGGTAAILANIDLAMLEANTVLQNSGVHARLRLVKAAEVAYTESGSVAGDLTHLQNPGDPVLGRVSRLREEYSADLVCMVTETGGDWDLYGLQGPSSENAFSIIRRPFLTGLNYFPVVLSFNFGCQLERPYADSEGAFPYAYGYSFSAGNTLYSTVEAFSGQRLAFFSNPGIIYEGVAAGVPDGRPDPADNVLVLNHTAPIVAAFRGGAPVTFPPSLQIVLPAGNTNSTLLLARGTNLTLLARASDQDGFVREVNFFYQDVASGTVQSLGRSTWAPFRFNWTNIPSGTWRIIAQAVNIMGASTRTDSGVVLQVIPPNDNYVHAAVVTGNHVSVVGTTAGATLENGEPNWMGGGSSVWYSWTAPARGRLSLSVSNLPSGTFYGAYTGASVSNLTTVDDNGGSAGEIEFPVLAGTHYRILVSGATNAASLFTLVLGFQPAPPNDDFEHRAILASRGAVAIANNFAASFQPGEPDTPAYSGTGATHRTLWWTWTAPGDGIITFTGVSDSGGCVVGVYQGSVLTNLTLIASSWTGPVSISVVRGQVCQIVADTLWGETGNIRLSAAFIPRPANDRFSNRTVIRGNWIVLTNSSLAGEIEPGTPADNGGVFPTLWWSWTAPASGYVSVNCPFGQFIDVYTGREMTSLIPVTSGSAAEFESRAGTTYSIAASGIAGDVAMDLILSTVRILTPTNGAKFVTGGNVVLTASATEVDSPLSRIEFFANGASLGVVSKAPYTLIWSNVPAGEFVLNATGTGPSGPPRGSPGVTIEVKYPAPPNDDFVNRTVISGNWVGVTNTVIGATTEPGEPSYVGQSFWNWNDSIWWSWTAPASGMAQIQSLGIPYSTALLVYTGSSLSNLTEVTSGIGGVSFEAVAGTAYAIDGLSYSSNIQFQLVLSDLRIASPSDLSIFTAGVNLPIAAAVTAVEEPVGEVEFFENGISLGIVTNAPYTLLWTNVPPGAFSLSLVATDIYGHARNSSPSVSIQVGPLNDDFLNAIPLTGSNLHIRGTTTGATSQPGEPNHDGLSAGNSVWYSWTAPTTANYSLVAQPAGGGLVPTAVYTGSSLSSLTLVSSNAYWPVCVLSAQAGTQYYIAVDSDGNPGDFDFYITQPPANDNFSNRIAIASANTLVTGNDLGATHEPGEPLYEYYGGTSVWWDWTAPGPGVVSFTVPDSLNPTLHIYSGSSISNLSLLPNQYGGPWDDIRELSFDVAAGSNYIIEADDRWNSDWEIEFTLNFSPRPANDNFNNAFVLAGLNVSTNGDNSLATSEPGEPHNGGSTSGHSVWYSWTAPSGGLEKVSASGSNFTPVIAIFTGASVSNLSIVAAGNGSVSFTPVAEITYQLAVDGSGGAFNLNLLLTPPPPNDDFASRQPLSGVRPVIHGTTYLSTSEPGEPGFYPWITSSSVWYSWVAPADGVAEISGGPKPVGVFTGNCVSNLTAVVPVGPGILTFPAVAGTEYEIAVAGAWWLADDFSLSIVLPKAQFASPTNGSAFPAPATFEIVARTIDLEGTVVTVGFYDGANLLGTVTNAPFQYIYSKVPAGSHMLSLQATDEYGFTTTNVPIEVRVQPFNDDFAQRFVINGLATNIIADNSGATTEPGESLPGGATGRTLWWTWQAPTSGTVTMGAPGFATASASASAPLASMVSSVGGFGRPEIQPADVIITQPPWGPPGPTAGPLIAVYTNAFISNLILCASNSGWYLTGDMTFDPVTGLVTQLGEWYVLPSLSFPVDGGQIYQISLDGVNGSFGQAAMTFNFAPPPGPPANDNFADRSILSGASISTNGTTVAATREPGEPLDASNSILRTVWYSWTAPSTGDAAVSESSPASPFDIGVYTGSQLTNLTTVSLGLGSVSFYAYAGTTYQIDMASSTGSGTSFQLYLSGAPLPPAFDPGRSRRLADGGFQLSLSGVRGQSFVIQASTNLLEWETIDVDTLPGASFDFVDTHSARLPRRFYRIVPLDSLY